MLGFIVRLGIIRTIRTWLNMPETPSTYMYSPFISQIYRNKMSHSMMRHHIGFLQFLCWDAAAICDHCFLAKFSPAIRFISICTLNCMHLFYIRVVFNWHVIAYNNNILLYIVSNNVSIYVI